jgi:hypothetical protein
MMLSKPVIMVGWLTLRRASTGAPSAGFPHSHVSLAEKVRGPASRPSLRGERLVVQVRGEIRGSAALIALDHHGSNPLFAEPEPHKARRKIMNRY